ncbi:Uncharacterised protein [Mycobacteroides abscessus subsp. abscessus]|nr:Uncharacterised protein [Mycobacteroides abscessus subsp. abscessus]
MNLMASNSRRTRSGRIANSCSGLSSAPNTFAGPDVISPARPFNTPYSGSSLGAVPSSCWNACRGNTVNR